MKRRFKDRVRQAAEAFKWRLGSFFVEKFDLTAIRGYVTWEMRDAATGELILHREKKNLIVRDAGLLLARLVRDPLEPSHGINMLAIGTGATGNVFSPDAPDNRQRRLNAEVARKTFSSIQYRDTNGAAVAYPTNVVDFTASFGEGEAVGPLNEMGLLSTISANEATLNPNPAAFPTYDATVDVTVYDILFNYLSFGAISKPSNAILTITWRLTF